jgi:riboflavin synthase
MFTGIVEEIGIVRRVAGTGATRRLDIAATATLEGSALGASVAVNGVCLTVVEVRPDGFAFDVGPETLERTAISRLAVGDGVNLERPLRLGAALGGHLVLGHVDGVAVVTDVTRVESTARVRFSLPGPDLAPLLVAKGSIAVDGVSLTIAELDAASFDVMLIPHTLEVTNLGRLRRGSAVNIEADVIGKYVLRSLALRAVRGEARPGGEPSPSTIEDTTT